MTVSQKDASAMSGTIIQAFASPIARIAYPFAEGVNEQLADLVLTRLYQVENNHTYNVSGHGRLGRTNDRRALGLGSPSC